MISQDLVQAYVSEYKYRLAKTVFDKLSLFEKEIILSAGKNYGFKVKENDSFFNVETNTTQTNKYQAALIIKGDYSIPEKGVVEIEEGRFSLHFLLFHFTLVNQRLKAISRILIEKKLVELFSGCDAEWLYASLSEQAETNFYESIQKLDKNMVVFEINFSSDSSFKIEAI